MNRLPGRVARVQSSGGLSMAGVQVAGSLVTALFPTPTEHAGYLDPGAAVSVLFKESEVAVAVGSVGRISIRNRLECTLAAMEKGPLLALLRLDFAGHPVAALITLRSADELGLAPGARVTALIKSTEISLEAAE